MKPPYVAFDGVQTALVPSNEGFITLAKGWHDGKPGREWEVLEWCPVLVVAGLYNANICGSIRSTQVEKSLKTLLRDAPKSGHNLTLEHTMATKKDAAPAADLKGQDKAKAPAKTKEAAAPAAKKTPAATKAVAEKAAAKEATKATAPAKTPAKVAKAADAGEGRKGRPSSLDVAAKLKKGATKLEGTVREGTVREALMKVIIGGVGKPLSEVLGVDATGNGHTVKSVDVHFAIEAGYVTL